MTQDSAEMQKMLDELEREFKPRKSIKDEVEKQLKPLFAKFYPTSEQYKLYQKYEDEFKKKFKRIIDFLERHKAFIKVFGKGVSTEETIEGTKHLNFVMAITYLLVTELIGTAFVDARARTHIHQTQTSTINIILLTPTNTPTRTKTFLFIKMTNKIL